MQGDSRVATHGKRRRHRAVGGLLIAATILAAFFAFRWLLTTPPRWWSAAGALPIDAAERAEALERGGSRAISEPRDDAAPWTIAISDSDANAWLVHRLNKWSENRDADISLPTSTDGSALPPPRIRIEDARLRLGIDAGGRVIGLAFTPRLDHRALYLTDPRIILGRIEFPAWITPSLGGALTQRLLESAAAEERSAIEAVLQGLAPVLDPARFTLDDGRSIDLLSIRCEPGRILVTCRTNPAPPELPGGPRQSTPAEPTLPDR